MECGEEFLLVIGTNSNALIGNGGGGPGGCGLHNPSYDFNDEILPVGVAYWTSLVETELPRRR